MYFACLVIRRHRVYVSAEKIFQGHVCLFSLIRKRIQNKMKAHVDYTNIGFISRMDSGKLRQYLIKSTRCLGVVFTIGFVNLSRVKRNRFLALYGIQKRTCAVMFAQCKSSFSGLGLRIRH